MAMSDDRLRTEKTAKVWLVKSGERIHGPLSFREIEVGLHSREFVGLDEITRPGGRWIFIREEAIFNDVLEEAKRNQMVAREDTEINTVSETSTPTESIPIAIDSAESPHSETAVPVQFESESDFTQTISQIRNFPEAKAEPARKSYGAHTDQRVKKKVAQSQTYLWSAIILITSFTLFYWLLVVRKEAASDHDQSHLHALIDAGLEDYRLGRFTEASHRLGEAEHEQTKNPEVSLKYAATLLHSDQSHLALLIADPLAQESTDGRMKRMALLIRGAAHFMENNFSDAQSDFNAVLSADPTDLTAVFNSGVVAYQLKSVKEAESSFRLALRIDPSHTPSILMLAKTLALKGGSEHLIEAIKILHDSDRKRWSLKQQSHILAASYWANLADDSRALSEAMKAVVTDGFATDAFWIDPIQITQDLDWSREMLPICEKFKSEHTDDIIARALYAICLQKSGKTPEASQAAVDVIRRFPGKALAHYAAGFVALAQGEEENSQAALELAVGELDADSEAELSIAVHTLRAHLCAKLGKDECLEDSLAQIKGGEPPPLFTEIFWLKLWQKKPSSSSVEMQSRMEKIRNRAPNFIPLLEFEAGL